jgi:hypothetical protein
MEKAPTSDTGMAFHRDDRGPPALQEQVDDADHEDDCDADGPITSWMDWLTHPWESDLTMLLQNCSGVVSRPSAGTLI